MNPIEQRTEPNPDAGQEQAFDHETYPITNWETWHKEQEEIDRACGFRKREEMAEEEAHGN